MDSIATLVMLFLLVIAIVLAVLLADHLWSEVAEQLRTILNGTDAN